MPPRRTTIIGWTGKGRLEDLKSSADYILEKGGIRARVSKMGACLAVDGAEPLGIAALLGHTPGVAWLAAGMAGRSARDLGTAARVLARLYLRRGDRFVVRAEGPDSVAASDLAGSITSGILDSVRGSRVSAESPRVVFRAAYDGESGAVGAEVRVGPGGVPTGEDEVVCLVSGGIHSSVVAWYASLQGLRVRLVHAESDEEALRSVARLYSELSHRVDPRWMSLEVLGGGSVLKVLSAYAESSKLPVYCGITRDSKSPSLPRVHSPLYLMPGERFEEEFGSLGLARVALPEDWNSRSRGRRRVRRFGGRAADVSGVLDGLR